MPISKKDISKKGSSKIEELVSKIYSEGNSQSMKEIIDKATKISREETFMEIASSLTGIDESLDTLADKDNLEIDGLIKAIKNSSNPDDIKSVSKNLAGILKAIKTIEFPKNDIDKILKQISDSNTSVSKLSVEARNGFISAINQVVAKISTSNNELSNSVNNLREVLKSSEVAKSISGIEDQLKKNASASYEMSIERHPNKSIKKVIVKRL